MIWIGLRRVSSGVRRWGAVLMMVTVITSGCGSAGPVTGGAAPAGSEVDFRGPVTVTDAGGTSSTFTTAATRIACLDPVCIDIATSLGMVPVAAIKAHIDLAKQRWFLGPGKAAKIAALGGSQREPNLEDLAAAQPDLIMGFVSNIGGPIGGIRESLRKIAPTYLYSSAPQKIDAQYDLLRTIGRVTGRAKAAEQAIATFQAKLSDLATRSPKNRSLMIAIGSNVNFTTYLSTSIMGQAFAQVTPFPWPMPAGSAEPISSTKYSIEQILSTDPDVIFLIDSGGTKNPLLPQLQAAPLWKELKAVKSGDVFVVPYPQWLFNYQLVLLSRMVDEGLYRIYPGVFSPPTPS